MVLVQDQYVQNSRKNYDTELQLKQNTSKQVFLDPKDFWKTESGCDEEINSSGNDSEGEDNRLYADPSDLPEEVFQTRKPLNPRKKNVRFGCSDFNYVLDTSETSSFDNEYPGIDCGYLDTGHRNSPQDPEFNHKIKDGFGLKHKTKWRLPDCGYDKPRPKSSPENIPMYLEGMERRTILLGEYDSHRVRRKDHRCGYYHGDYDFDEVTCKKSTQKSHKYGCGDDITTRCCDHCLVEPRLKNNFVKMKPTASTCHKYVCHMIKDSEPDIKTHRKLRDFHYDPQGIPCHATSDRYCLDEYYDHAYGSKSKKKILEAVQEQQEQFSDSTYKVPCAKYSSQTIPGELSGFQRKRSSEKFTNSSQSDWLYYSGKGNGGSVGERVGPPRMHKLRSRRTRMNRIKNGWKKAFVQTVRDGSRNERVGVIVMGSKGPEFYSKNSENTEFVPFRKSKSFLDGAAKSFEVMTVDCKNVFLSSSEPGPRTNYAINDLVCPEDDKVEEKIAKFSKNVNEIVKNSEEKFYKALSASEYPEKKRPPEEAFKGTGEDTQEGRKDEKKDDVLKTTYPSFHLLPLSAHSPRGAKSLRKPEKIINEESKAMADALNEQAKKYLENQSNLQGKDDSFLEELEEFKKYTPVQIGQERVEANLSPWGMNLGNLSERVETQEQPGAEGKSGKKNVEEKSDERDKTGKDELNQTGSVKSTEQISLNKQRRKKYYESTTSGVKDVEDAGTMVNSKPQSGKRVVSKIKKWECPNESFERQHEFKDADSSLISAVFRDLVENGCAISQEESENLQSIFNQVSYNTEACSNEVMSSCSSEVINSTRGNKTNVSPRSLKSPISLEEQKVCRGTKEGAGGKRKEYFEDETKDGDAGKKAEGDKCGDFFEEVNSRKVLKMNFFDEKICKKVQSKHKDVKKKKAVLEDKMKLLRETLPSIAAENEATHLKQLKKYIDRFIDRVEASTTTEFCGRKENRPKSKDAASVDSSEIRVDARKILEFVSNPFRKISSDVTINIAKKLTDALVQDKSTRCPKHPPPPPKGRKHSDNETDEDGLLPCESSSGSERCEEPEPTYLKQLKKMRNEHLNNIVLEVKRLSELLRFLDRCNRLHF